MNSGLNRFRFLFWPVLVFCHMALMAVLLFKFGLNSGNEGDKYLTSATTLAEGNIKQALEYQTFYSAYIFYLWIFAILNLPLPVIFFCTWLLSIFACIRTYLLLKNISGIFTGRVWLTIMLLSPALQFWQLNLFSEIFFISVNLLFLCEIFNPQKKNLFLIALFSLLLVFTRPAGIFTVLASLLFTGILRFPERKKLLNTIFASVIVFIFIFIVFFIPMHFRGVCHEVVSGAVYAGFPTLPLPESLPAQDATLFDCYAYIRQQHGSGVLIKLFPQKFFSFFNLNRSYFTPFHNAINAFHYIFFTGAAAALFLVRGENSERSALIKTSGLVIILNALLVSFFFNEWSERYTVQVLPLVFICFAHTFSLIKKTGNIAV